MFSERVENPVGKGEIARNEQFLLFPTVFFERFVLYTRKNQGWFGKGVNLVHIKQVFILGEKIPCPHYLTKKRKLKELFSVDSLVGTGIYPPLLTSYVDTAISAPTHWFLGFLTPVLTVPVRICV